MGSYLKNMDRFNSIKASNRPEIGQVRFMWCIEKQSNFDFFKLVRDGVLIWKPKYHLQLFPLEILVKTFELPDGTVRRGP